MLMGHMMSLRRLHDSLRSPTCLSANTSKRIPIFLGQVEKHNQAVQAFQQTNRSQI